MLACSIHESTINNLHDKKVKVRAAIAAAATHMQAECNFKNEVKVGSMVVLLGIAGKKELNGAVGFVRAFDEDSGRFLVAVPSVDASSEEGSSSSSKKAQSGDIYKDLPAIAMYKLKPENLRVQHQAGTEIGPNAGDLLDLMNGKARPSMVALSKVTMELVEAVVAALAADKKAAKAAEDQERGAEEGGAEDRGGGGGGGGR